MKSLNSTPVGKILTSQELKGSLPLCDSLKKCVCESKIEISKILTSKSNKKIVIIGPCSADFEEPLIEYASFIKQAREFYKDKMEIIMRFYTGKPRSIGGWKGLSNSRPGNKPDISRGIIESRNMAITLLQIGVPLADEMLHPELVNMFNDIYSYQAVGARSTENQFHREVASGLDIAVGFKNPTSGDIETMVNSILAGQTKSSYVIGDTIYDSIGNNLSHGILRGGRINSKNLSNYSTEDLKLAIDLLTKKEANNPSFIIDTNHENSNKQYEKQIDIMHNVFRNLEKLKIDGIDTSMFKGFMVESYLYDGRQERPKDNDETKIMKGQSLTDPCIGIEKTKIFLEELAEEIIKKELKF